MADGQPDGSEPSIRSIVDALPGAVVVTDPRGRIIMWNSKAEGLYGWSEEEVLGRTTLDVLPSVEPEDDPQALLARVLAGEPYEGDRTVLRRDGQPVRIRAITEAVLDPAGAVRFVVGSSEDVAERRLLEQLNGDLTARLQLALQAGGLGTWRWDLATGEVNWDDRMEALFGFDPGGFDGTFASYQAALHPEDRNEVLAAVERAMATGSPYTVEHRVVGRSGDVRWIEGAGMPTLGPDGTVTGAIGCSMDITGRVAAAEAERVSRVRFEFLSAITAALADASSTEEIMVAVTRTAVPRLGDWCSVFVATDDPRTPLVETFHIDPEMVDYARELTLRYPFDPDAPTGMGAVMRTGTLEYLPEITPQVIDDALADSGFADAQIEDLRLVLARLSLRSAISVPLMKHGRVLGGLSFTTTSDRRALDENDLALAQVVAGRVASSLENRRLSDQQRVIATTLQASLLPRALPDVPGLDVAVRYWAAGEGTEVGGDFYDLFALDDRSWAAVIGDVCGTGPDAAALTAIARHSIRQSAWRGDDPATIMHWLNRTVRSASAPDMTFLTTSYVTLETGATGFDIEITTAGHPPAIIVRADGRADPVGARGTLIGPFATITTRPTREHLGRGDALVLYTDGLTDVPPPHDLDPTQTIDLLAACCAGAGDADTVAQRLEAAVTDRLRIQQRPDDIALLVLRVT